VTTDRRDSTADAPAELAAGLVEDVQKLARLELALARQELKELAVRNAVAIGFFAVAALLVVLGIFVAVPVLVVVLVPDHWLAALIWVAAYLVAGGILALVGKLRLQIALPPKTLSSLKETKEWALRQISSTGK
jgi:hypothetical protein